jgi:hypothetical protein
MAKSKRNKRAVQPDEGAGEPLMLVTALVVAAWLAFTIYGDRSKEAASQPPSRAVSALDHAPGLSPGDAIQRFASA